METFTKIIKSIFKFILLPLIGMYGVYSFLKDKKINILSSKNITIKNTPEVDEEKLKTSIEKGKTIIDNMEKL